MLALTIALCAGGLAYLVSAWLGAAFAADAVALLVEMRADESAAPRSRRRFTTVTPPGHSA